MKDVSVEAAAYAANKTNEVITQAIAQAFADGYQMGYKNRKESITEDYKTIALSTLSMMKENLFIVKSNDKYGAINKQGDIIIPIQYTGCDTDPYEDYDEYEGLSCIFWDKEKIDFYDSDGELLGTETHTYYANRHMEEHYYDDDQDYDYERDTYYALGGDDYDEWRDNGGNLDDMMDGMGL